MNKICTLYLLSTICFCSYSLAMDYDGYDTDEANIYFVQDLLWEDCYSSGEENEVENFASEEEKGTKNES